MKSKKQNCSYFFIFNVKFTASSQVAAFFHVAKLLRQIIETKLISLYNVYEKLCSNARKSFCGKWQI